jgi:hypothetical protein
MLMKQLFSLLRSLLVGAAAACAFACAQAATFNIAGTSWFYDAGEVPAMCMVFEPGGTLRFQGGYLGYNPSRWRQDSTNPALVHIELGGKQDFPTAVAKDQLRLRPQGSLASFDAGKRLLVYRIGLGDVPIEFNGFFFARQPACAHS